MRHPAAPMCGRMTAKPSTQHTLQLGISDAAAGSGLRELYRRLLLAYENHVVPKTDEELASLAGLATGTWTLLSWFWDILFASLKVGGAQGCSSGGCWAGRYAREDKASVVRSITRACQRR